MEDVKIVKRLVAIWDEAEKQHPDYICDEVLSPIFDQIIDMYLDALGVPNDTTMDYPNGDDRAFCRDWYWEQLRSGNIAELFEGVKDLRDAGFVE